MISLIQLLVVIFATFAASRAILRFKDKKISFHEVIFWLGVWIVLGVVVFFPDITGSLAEKLGIGRGIDVVIYVSIGLLYYLIFRLYVMLEETEREITRLVREIAISRKKKKK